MRFVSFVSSAVAFCCLVATGNAALKPEQCESLLDSALKISPIVETYRRTIEAAGQARITDAQLQQMLDTSSLFRLPLEGSSERIYFANILERLEALIEKRSDAEIVKQEIRNSIREILRERNSLTQTRLETRATRNSALSMLKEKAILSSPKVRARNTNVTINPSGRFAAFFRVTGKTPVEFIVADLGTGREQVMQKHPLYSIPEQILFSPDGSMLYGRFIGGVGRAPRDSVIGWNVSTGERAFKYHSHGSETIRRIGFSSTGSFIALVTPNQSANLPSIVEFREKRTFGMFPRIELKELARVSSPVEGLIRFGVTDMVAAPDGTLFMAVRHDGSNAQGSYIDIGELWSWKPGSDRLERHPIPYPDDFSFWPNAHLSRDGSTLIAPGHHGKAFLMRTSFPDRGEIFGHPEQTGASVLSPSGRYTLYQGPGRLWIHDNESGEEYQKALPPGLEPDTIYFAGDHSLILSATDGTIRLYDLDF